MRLSDVKGRRVLHVLAELVEPIARIAQDEDVAVLFKPQPLADGQTSGQALAERARKAVPVLLSEHEDDVILILSLIDGVEPEEYAEQLTLGGFIEDVYELLTDEESLGFLSSQLDNKTKSG